MAAISTSIQLADQMTPALRAISTSMNLVINTCESMQSVSSRAIDTAALRAARAELDRIDIAAEQVEAGLRDASVQQGDFNRQLAAGSSQANGLLTKVKQMVSVYAGIRTVRAGIDFIQNATSAQDIQQQYETKLQTVMGQRMNAGQVEFQAVLDTASMQQQIGVIGDEVQLAGAGQLATFLNSTEALNTLIPAMDNLAASQKGCSASAEDLANIGNMMGKVMQGQVGALTRVGVTFTDAQEQALKYGNEQERAATLAQVIADNVGQMNAALANTPQGIIASMKNDWGDVFEVVGQRLYPSVVMFFQTLQSYMPQASAMVMNLANAMVPGIDWLATTGIPAIVNAASVLYQIVSGVGNFIAGNWGAIEPVIWGLAGAFTAYTIALGINTVVTWIANGAAKAFFATLLANPLFWIAIAIGIVIAAIVAWVNHIGGLRVAWLTCVNAVMTAGDNLKLAFAFMSMHVQNTLYDMQYAFAAVKVGILNALSLMKVGGLAIIEAFLNGVIDRINRLIEFVNNIPGVSIEAIGKVELVASAAAEEQAKIQQRASDLAAMKEENSAAQKANQQNYMWQKLQADAAKDQRNWEIWQLQQKGKSSALDLAAASSYSIAAMAYDDLAGGIGDIGGNTGNTAGNTARMADSMDMAEEDLQSMRDMAEAEVINRFTTAELTVNMGGITNQVNSQMDLDGIGSYLEEQIFGVLETAAEGVY